MTLRGIVVRGKQLGRTLGFPTANLDCPGSLPQNGVYAVRVRVRGEEYIGMLNQGKHPTVPEGAPTVEIYLLDFEGDIYGETMTVEVDDFMRPETRFDGLEALKAQLNKDRETIRNFYHGGKTMQNTYTVSRMAGPSRCDSAGRESLADLFEQFQDIASEHGAAIGVGLPEMAKKGLFWMTVRTKIRIHRRANMLEPVQITTWPKTPGATRCDRCYRMNAGDGSLLAEGRTEWCAVNMETGRPSSPKGLFPEDFDFCEETAAEGAYARFPHDFTEDELKMTVPVRACEIDVGRHLNNVAYVRLLTDTFSAKELAKMNVTEAEMLFLSPVKEGETLKISRRDTEGQHLFGIQTADGKYAALGLIKTEA